MGKWIWLNNASGNNTLICPFSQRLWYVCMCMYTIGVDAQRRRSDVRSLGANKLKPIIIINNSTTTNQQEWIGNITTDDNKNNIWYNITTTTNFLFIYLILVVVLSPDAVRVLFRSPFLTDVKYTGIALL